MLIFQIIFFVTKCCLTFQIDDFNNSSANASSSNQPSKLDDEFSDLKYALELSLKEEKDCQMRHQQQADDESVAMAYAIERSMEDQKNDALPPKVNGKNHLRNDISSSINAAASTTIAQAGRSITTALTKTSSYVARLLTQYKSEPVVGQDDASSSNGVARHHLHGASTSAAGVQQSRRWQHGESSTNDAARHHRHGASTSADGLSTRHHLQGASTSAGVQSTRHPLHSASTSASVQSRRWHSDSSTNDAARHRLHSAGFPSVPSTQHLAASSSSGSSSLHKNKSEKKKTKSSSSQQSNNNSAQLQEEPARRKKGKSKKKHHESSSSHPNPSNSSTQKDLVAIDQMFADNIAPEIIYNKLTAIQANESLQTVEVHSRLARVCFLRALNMPSDNDIKWKAKQQEIEKGLNFANDALAVDAQHLNTLKYVCMLMGLQFDDRISNDQKISLAVNLNKFLQRANQSEPEILHAQGRLKYSLARISSFNRMLAIQINSGIKALFNDASYDSALTKLLKAETFFQGTSIDNYFYLGKCYQRMGDKKLAKHYYDRLMGMEPKNLREKECQEITAKIKI